MVPYYAFQSNFIGAVLNGKSQILLEMPYPKMCKKNQVNRWVLLRTTDHGYQSQEIYTTEKSSLICS